MPISASANTTVSSRVSIARYAISTAVTGLSRPVPARCAAAKGASVGAGSGSSSTIAASPPVTKTQSIPAASCRPLPGFSPAGAVASIARNRVPAPSKSTPVTPPPIAASVSATSGAAIRTQTSASSRPYATNPTTAANASRAAVVQTATPRTKTARPMSKTKALRHAGGPPGRAVRAISWEMLAPASRARSQTPISFSAASSPPA